MTRHLSLKTGLPLLRQAFIDKRLGAQNVDKVGLNAGCRYRYPGTNFCCGIGAMLPDGPETDDLDNANNATVDELIQIGSLTAEPGEEHILKQLQQAHDNWFSSIQMSNEQDFTVLLNGLLTEHGLETV